MQIHSCSPSFSLLNSVASVSGTFSEESQGPGLNTSHHRIFMFFFFLHFLTFLFQYRSQCSMFRPANLVSWIVTKIIFLITVIGYQSTRSLGQWCCSVVISFRCVHKSRSLTFCVYLLCKIYRHWTGWRWSSAIKGINLSVVRLVQTSCESDLSILYIYLFIFATVGMSNNNIFLIFTTLTSPSSCL